MEYGCAATSFSAIGFFVEVLRTTRKVILVGFYDDISNKPIPIGSDVTETDLKNGTHISHMKGIPLIQGGSNSLLLT